MKPPKRRIIKTRPQRPYVIARVVIALIVAVALGLAVWWSQHQHPAHALARVPTRVKVACAASVAFLWQEGPIAKRMPPLRASVERSRS